MKPYEPTNQDGRLRSALRAAVAGLALGLLLVPGGASATLCPPTDGVACFVRCRLHKQECGEACRAEKKQCLQRVRAGLQECRLACHNDDEAAADPGSCKENCVARALELARSECGLGKRTCVDTCNPESCRELCGFPPIDSPAVDDPASPAVSEQSAVGESETCEPPIDRECLGACARELKSCAERVREDGLVCLEGCGDLRGPDRWQCVRRCAAAALEQGTVCRESFRLCASECLPADAPADPPASE